MGVKMLATQKNKANRETERRIFRSRCAELASTSRLNDDDAAVEAALKSVDRAKLKLCFRLYDKHEFQGSEETNNNNTTNNNANTPANMNNNNSADPPRPLAEKTFVIKDSNANEEANYDIHHFLPRSCPAASGCAEMIVVCGKVTKDNARVVFRDRRPDAEWKREFVPGDKDCKLFGNTTFVISPVPVYPR